MHKTVHVNINTCDFYSFCSKLGSGAQDLSGSLQAWIWFLTVENKYQRLTDGIAQLSAGVVQRTVYDVTQHLPMCAAHWLCAEGALAYSLLRAALCCSYHLGGRMMFT